MTTPTKMLYLIASVSKTATVLLISLSTVWRETLVGGNVGEFGESSVICQTKTIQISTYH